MKIESSDSIEQASSSRSLFTVSGMIAKNPGSHHNALLDLLWKGGQRRFGQTEGTRFTQRLSVSMEARSKHGFRGRHLVEDGSEPRSSATVSAGARVNRMCWMSSKASIYQFTASGPACWRNAALLDLAGAHKPMFLAYT